MHRTVESLALFCYYRYSVLISLRSTYIETHCRTILTSIRLKDLLLVTSGLSLQLNFSSES